MAEVFEIDCVVKTHRMNPHERIESIGGRHRNGGRWKCSQQEAIAGIESQRWSFVVRNGGHPVRVVVAKSRYGHKYIKTEADGEQPNNLLSLNSCPL